VEKLTEHQPDSVREFFYVAMANVIAGGAGNFAFGPEIYRTKPKHDHDVIGHFARQTAIMIADLERLKAANGRATHAEVFEADARSLDSFPRRFSAVITSPPYPNEKDYTRTTRVEAVLLRFVEDRQGLRSLKENLLRSNTRNVFVKDEDAAEVAEFASIRKVCEEIENRRIELGKTSGFERLYHKVVAHYFGGMRRHFRGLKMRMRTDSHLAYVVGDQYSFLMVPIRTARLLAEVAESEGFKVEGIDLWRERVGTKIRNSSESMRTVRIREEVLRLRS
jgi:hypothetical protein